jgi:mitochondrial fission protein ELM1
MSEAENCGINPHLTMYEYDLIISPLHHHAATQHHYMMINKLTNNINKVQLYFNINVAKAYNVAYMIGLHHN